MARAECEVPLPSPLSQGVGARGSDPRVSFAAMPTSPSSGARPPGESAEKSGDQIEEQGSPAEKSDEYMMPRGPSGEKEAEVRGQVSTATGSALSRDDKAALPTASTGPLSTISGVRARLPFAR